MKPANRKEGPAPTSQAAQGTAQGRSRSVVLLVPIPTEVEGGSQLESSSTS